MIDLEKYWKNNAVQVRFKIKITNLIKGTVAQDEIGLESVVGAQHLW